jgi:hypothetical protein
MARARSAKEKQAISQGLKEFWDDKGRSILKVGGAGLAVGGALTLAAKSGKLPKGLGKKGMRNGHKAPMKMLPPWKNRNHSTGSNDGRFGKAGSRSYFATYAAWSI